MRILSITALCASTVLGVSHGEFNAHMLCKDFAEHMSKESGTNVQRDMMMKINDFSGYQFISPRVFTNIHDTAQHGQIISLTEGSVEVVSEDHMALPTNGEDMGVCQFEAMSLDNPTPGMKTKTAFEINYYKIK